MDSTPNTSKNDHQQHHFVYMCCNLFSIMDSNSMLGLKKVVWGTEFFGPPRTAFSTGTKIPLTVPTDIVPLESMRFQGYRRAICKSLKFIHR